MVNDFADVVSPAYEQKIAAITGELLQKTGTAVVVATMPDIGGAEYNDYVARLYRAWGIGKRGEDNGVLIFITVKERKMRIETGYGVEGILPDGLAGEIRDRYMMPYLKKNEFGQGLL
ncbi:MAG: TPM domain-containing protein, partial [Thermodesulfobacteriota bacterium]|nr:TPM domain-containing protein [Thermodesulfobacteriota bacterium]